MRTYVQYTFQMKRQSHLPIGGSGRWQLEMRERRTLADLYRMPNGVWGGWNKTFERSPVFLSMLTATDDWLILADIRMHSRLATRLFKKCGQRQKVRFVEPSVVCSGLQSRIAQVHIERPKTTKQCGEMKKKNVMRWQTWKYALDAKLVVVLWMFL